MYTARSSCLAPVSLNSVPGVIQTNAHEVARFCAKHLKSTFICLTPGWLETLTGTVRIVPARNISGSKEVVFDFWEEESSEACLSNRSRCGTLRVTQLTPHFQTWLPEVNLKLMGAIKDWADFIILVNPRDVKWKPAMVIGISRPQNYVFMPLAIVVHPNTCNPTPDENEICLFELRQE
jgi:hypothetical protein